MRNGVDGKDIYREGEDWSGLWGGVYAFACTTFEMALMWPTIYVKHTLGCMRLELRVKLRLKIKIGSLIIWVVFKAMGT